MCELKSFTRRAEDKPAAGAYFYAASFHLFEPDVFHGN